MPTIGRPAIEVVPYPRQVRVHAGKTTLGASSVVELSETAGPQERLAAKMLKARLQAQPEQRELPERSRVRILLGSLATRGAAYGALTKEQRAFLADARSDQAYVLSVSRKKVVIVGRGSIGLLYGVQTLLQMLGREGALRALRTVEVFDQPATEDRYLAIAMSWYTGYGRVGFDSQLWGRDQWFWFVDWCLEHKVNGINLCMYGYYPFEFEEYPEVVFRDVETTTWLPEAGVETKVKYTHPNVTDEFLPELIRYANARGITVLAYIGLNTFNGGYALAHPESRYQSDHPEKFHQFRFNLCPSRADVRRYFDATIRRLLDIGFNGILLEESEGSGFCECSSCSTRYYRGGHDSREALHRADYELFNRLYGVAKRYRPKTTMAIRAWRMGSETGASELQEGKKRIPEDTLVFWSNAMDPARFEGWVDAFGPGRIMGQDAETMGFSTLYDGLIFMFPRQYSSYISYVDPEYRPSYAQCLPNDVAQYKLAAKKHCRGVTGYAFNWNGWELAPLALAQYGWNPSSLSLDKFVDLGYSHQFGKWGPTVARAILNLPLVLETRICEGARRVPRDDPVSGGLAGLTSLQVPSAFGEGKGEIDALEADLRRAKRSLELLRTVRLQDLDDEQDRITLRYFLTAAERTVCICRAGITYRQALEAMRASGSERRVRELLRESLYWTKEDYRLVRQNVFDMSEEFHQRIVRAIDTISRRLERYPGGSHS